MPSSLLRALIIAIAGFTLVGCSTYVPEGVTTPSQLSQATIVAKINQVRRAHHQPALTYNAKLEQAARTQANLMASKDVLSHELGGRLRERTNVVNYRGAVGENLAGGHKTLEAAIEGWLNSPSHRSTLLNSKFSEFGLAVARVAPGRSSRYGTYWAIIMGGDTNLWIQTR